ncbi:hypothetical protein CMV_003211 [Castanea mollissima]|uniref:Uncharacterized protein n=1 Tax=Castanea mollissima TaxID=60419 RepID=A0A8J4RWD3_9ROSI|nr:hypothetical protein CMV_003211 [Castanea mollissima]
MAPCLRFFTESVLNHQSRHPLNMLGWNDTKFFFVLLLVHLYLMIEGDQTTHLGSPYIGHDLNSQGLKMKQCSFIQQQLFWCALC